MKQSNGINMLALVLLGLGLSYAIVTANWGGDAVPRRAGGFGSNTWEHTTLRITNSGTGEYWEIERPDRPLTTGRWYNVTSLTESNLVSEHVFRRDSSDPNDTSTQALLFGGHSNVTEVSIVCTNCWATNQFRLLP